VASEAGSGSGTVHHVDFRKVEGLERMLDITEVGEILKMGPSWVHRETRRGNLPGKLIGNKYRFKPSELQAWIDAQGKKATG
jgi:predicted DNA-binding transcriptional regulator AlpA